ncbi:alkaline phosphatase family protein [Halieaceae bacterium IMCC14734]|uniref:Alkaline phosphatase family protein n=1 Tax=Candidatus Litorirhabdus singularis TaxID=2518993 RepID=A0ABT3TN60_9GAMM|nr:alkaline phosphatase family protein [Candidatus Litorirhabdus singularis]MCX2983176.1 alkaline phosphatase family protein [Candidatus Litorirhabdus singularis]
MAKTILPLLTLLSLMVPLVSTAADKPPRLVLQITVDQLRGDLPARYLEKMGKGGFRYLLSEGVVYENAHHAHSNTETIVGHATLATGAYPADHGLIANIWFDRESGEMTYNIEDSRYPLLTKGADVDKATEIDPTQRVARSDGRSPAAMLVSTFSDELAIHTANTAKIFGVSVKDRGAVSMAGHAGKAFWFSKATGEFVTSSFYYDQYPQWVSEFNAKQPAQRYANQNWELMLEPSAYTHADADDQAWETNLGDYGRVFPHPYGPGDGKYFTTQLTVSPAGDELTLEFAKQLIDNEAIGEDAVTDYLSVSFSSTDYVGHLFGPSSLEAEDNLLRLDRTLADLLAYVDHKVGLKNTLVVLSADHGSPEVPPLLNEYGIEAGYVTPDNWDTAAGIVNLKQKFGIGGELIQKFFPPYIYLNRQLIRDQGLNQAAVEKAVAREMMMFEGVSLALSTTALMNGQVADTDINRLILNSHNPRRSGDVFIVFEPNWFINDFDGLTVAVTHGSPWRYDTYVPVIFAGAGLKSQRVFREIETVDIASTLSQVIGTNRPSGARGQVLPEVLQLQSSKRR